MKKLGFIAIAMVTLLATLGIGFSMWQQTVVVTGTVNTGSLSFKLSDPTGTWVFKDINTGAAITITGAVGTQQAFLPGVPQGVYLPVSGVPVVGNDTVTLFGCAYSTIAANGLSATMSWWNIFPIAPFVGTTSGLWTADLSLVNSSTIPVKFHAVVSSATGMSLLTGPTITFTGPLPVAGGPAPQIALEGYQMEPGADALHVNVGVSVPDLNSSMKQTGSFTITIQAVQWNEFAGTTIQ
jgi:hypothetical protein